jgi:hypothetical protein
MGLSLQRHLKYSDEGEDMLNRIVTSDKSWVHHYQPKSKHAMETFQSHSTIKFKVMPSAGMVMRTMFWDSQVVLKAHFHKCGENMNCASYCEVLLKLWDAVHRKRLGQLARGVLLHHDNARPSTARVTQERIQKLQWELLQHRLTARTWPLVTPSVWSAKTTALVANVLLMMKRLKRRC